MMAVDPSLVVCVDKIEKDRRPNNASRYSLYVKL